MNQLSPVELATLDGRLSATAALHFRDGFRSARQRALEDAEAFDGVLFTLERFGSFLAGRIAAMGEYAPYVAAVAARSPLSAEVPARWPELHIEFGALYELVRDARNSALHQGAFARHLTTHALELAIVLEDALMSGCDQVGHFMVKGPVCACLWQPVSFIRQTLLQNSFSYLPVLVAEPADGGHPWRLVSDCEVARYLRSAAGPKEQKSRMIRTLGEAVASGDIALLTPRVCHADTPIRDVLDDHDRLPVLVTADGGSHDELVGILTAFDVL